jgi:hypothetical protein
MIILIVMLNVVSATSVVVDYPALAMGHGWIQIGLRAAEQVQVQRVDWCKSGVPNADDPPDIDECNAPNLQHMRLYPSARTYLRTPEEAEPNMLYISADDLGGWDMQHQFVIIVSGNKGAFRQVVRFNPLPPPKPASTDATSTDAPSTDAPSTDATSTDATSTDATSTDAASTDAASTDAASTHAASTDAVPSPHPWFGAGLFLGSGLVLIVLVTLLIRWRQHRQSPHGRLASIAEATAYQWNQPVLPPPGSEIEMMPLRRTNIETE